MKQLDNLKCDSCGHSYQEHDSLFARCYYAGYFKDDPCQTCEGFRHTAIRKAEGGEA